MDAKIDVRRGQLTIPGGETFFLDGSELSIVYWHALGAPMSRIAIALGLDTADLTTRCEALADRLGLSLDTFAGRLEFAEGRSPMPRKPWEQRTFAHLIDDAFETRDQNSTLVFASGAGALTVCEVRELVCRIRAKFRSAGIEKGDTIAADAGPYLEIYLLSLASFLHGTRLVRLNEQVPASALCGMLEAVPADLIFTARRDMIQSPPAEVISIADGITPAGEQSFEAWLKSAPEPIEVDRVRAAIDPCDIATIAFTSGSSGTPKGVAIPHEMAWATANRTSFYYDFGPDDMYYSATDLSSNTSQNILIALPLMCGGTTVLPSLEALTSPLASALDCETYGVTCLMTVPSVLRTILKTEEQAKKSRLATLRLAICTTAPLGEALAARFHAICQARLVEAFATRETGTILVALDTDTVRVAEGGGVFVEMLGRVLMEDGSTAAPGDIGELCVQGPRFDHYLYSDGSTEPSGKISGGEVPNHPGWYRTGDLGRYGAHGTVEIVGRKRDIVKSPDGRLILPSRIESILNASPHVAESCVFRMLDDDGVERIGAAIVPVQSGFPPDICAMLRETVRQERGAMETPVRVLILDQIPQVSRNKPDKPKLATMLKQRISTDLSLVS